MFNIDEMKTMDYQRYSEYLDENPKYQEIGKYDSLDIAVEKSIMIAEVPEKFGLPSDTTTAVIKMVTEQYGMWSNEMVDDGYVVVAEYE